MVPPLNTGLASLGLYDSALHNIAEAPQGVLAAGVSTEVPSPYPSALAGKIATISIFHPRFACRVAVDGDLPPVWEAVARVKGRMEELANLNRDLMRVLPSCCQVFVGRAHFRSPPARVCQKCEPAESIN